MALNELKYLLAVGCSHFAGSEINGHLQPPARYDEIKKSVPGRIAEDLQLHYRNLSVAGGSNGYIFRTTIDWVTRYLEQGRDPAELLVVVGWSTDERLEFTWEDTHYHWANGCDWEPIYNDGQGPNFKTWFKALQLYHTDFSFGKYCKIINIIALDNFLKRHNIKYVQLASCGKLAEHTWEESTTAPLKFLFPFDTYFEPHDSFIDQYLDTHKDRFTPWLHADEYLHNLYSEKVIQFIKDTYE